MDRTYEIMDLDYSGEWDEVVARTTDDALRLYYESAGYDQNVLLAVRLKGDTDYGTYRCGMRFFADYLYG